MDSATVMPGETQLAFEPHFGADKTVFLGQVQPSGNAWNHIAAAERIALYKEADVPLSRTS